jgi:hypothetical protein
MELVVETRGTLRCMYGEEIDLAAIGRLTIVRGSFVEPDSKGHWITDLSPINGPILGPFMSRSIALAVERSWIEEDILAVARHSR